MLKLEAKLEGADQMKIRAVLFDLFETLITEFASGKRKSNRSYDYQALLGLSNEDYKKEWRARQEQRMSGFFPDYRAVLKDILLARSLPYHDSVVNTLYEERVREKQLPFQSVEPDIKRLLDSLKNRKLKLALVSNCTEEEVKYWQDSGLAAYFDTVIFSYEAGCAKPDQRIYELACSRLAVRADECFFVGDGGSNELEGAERAGLNPLHATWFNTFIESKYKKLTHPNELLQELD
ncbi:HAD family hydrolase [Paenibacillus spongiae]|uniref:HAD family hydrolase n=1 Tax=Paenibacillus spongiae TaxID=2909671 RepID=A0ABY5S2Y1_9BACL|nr:HAD family hydrolase [Paenibacillus spongiae]UVI28019.1 HAD family hydrolase [Paenibacillus spongiae]